MRIKAIKTSVFRERQDLVRFILRYVVAKENSIVVVTSKILSLSEGRVAPAHNKEKTVRGESDFYLNAKAWFTIKDGMIMPKAGVDESNGDGKLILLPEDSFKSAVAIRRALIKEYKIKNLGIIISDSNFLPMRSGAIGVALGYAGFEGVKNQIGKKDIFGRVLKFTKTNVADSLATAAVLCMGEGNERSPLALITDVPAVFKSKVDKREIKINRKDDMYYPLIKDIYAKKKKKES